jgi:3-deoxy-manno-octulosonate cytidylyltransferase (CMP-KDO synthetase)
MSFIVIIPARFASTRLPNKPLADLGGKPMIVRVAERAAQSGAVRIVVATDHRDIYAACEQHGIDVAMTRADHLSGTDRVAEVAAALELSDDAVVVNVQGDEPLIDPSLIVAVAAQIKAGVPMATAAHRIELLPEMFNPNVVKVVLNKDGGAMYFSRAAIPWHRDDFVQSKENLSEPHSHEFALLRHIGMYAYTNQFLQIYPTLTVSPLERIEALEQLRVLWHGYAIAVHVTSLLPEAGVDTLEDLERVRKHFGVPPDSPLAAVMSAL